MNWLPLVAMAIWCVATVVTLVLFVGWVRRAEDATERLKLAQGGVLVLRPPLRRIRDLNQRSDKPVPRTAEPGAVPAGAADSADTQVKT